MTTPAIRALKETGRPRITLLTSPTGAPCGELVPEIDEVLVYRAPWMKAAPERGRLEPAAGSPDRALIKALARRKFDGAVIFTVYSQSPLPAALMCYLADIPLRLACCRENPYHLLSDWVPESEPQTTIRHEVRRQLDLVDHIGAQPSDERLSLQVPAEAREQARELLGALAVNESFPWLLIHPGASAVSRRYPLEMFAAVTRILTHRGQQCIFIGQPHEVELIETIRAAAGPGSFSLAGRLNLAQLAALIELAPVLIANNSGPVHVAAAVGTPVVDLYALTNPQHTPWQVPHRLLSHDVPCKYCYKSICPEGHHNCLALVTPERVVEAALDLLRESSRETASAVGV
jgi:lipopolysaccharide heptosyltransferase II